MEGGGAAVTQFSSRHNTPRRRPSRRQGQRIAGKRESGSERPGSGIAPSAGASEPHPRPLQGPHDTDDYKKWRAQQDKRNEKKRERRLEKRGRLSQLRDVDGPSVALLFLRPKKCDKRTCRSLFSDFPDIEDVPNPRELPRAASPRMMVVPLRSAGHIIQARRVHKVICGCLCFEPNSLSRMCGCRWTPR